MEFRILLNMSRLRFDPVMNRRTLYAALTIGKRTIWAQRWDTWRSTRPDAPHTLYFKSSDGLMSWTFGKRVSV